MNSEENAPDPLESRAELRRHGAKEPILEASLVLASQGIKHWMEFDGKQYILTVDPDDASPARQVLAQYDDENTAFHSAEEAGVPAMELRLSPLLHLSIPVAVFFWAGSSPWQSWLTRRGGADAKLILEGEWWRCLTATTLHADHSHFLGNMISGFFILNLLRRRCGPGLSMVLLTAAAGITNFAVALASPEAHFSIGFSTVVFAALGLLAGIETLHLPRQALGGLRQLSPLIAALFLAVLVGIGERSDIKAHFFGFGFGAAFSPLAGWLGKKMGAPPWQVAGILVVYAVYLGVWLIAQ
jgi:membrane associated rhomboid family serine protease